jgi:hypothetical protein
MMDVRVWAAGLILCVVAIVFSPQLLDMYLTFISKGDRAAEVWAIGDAYQTSRGFILEDMLDNIAMNPWLGIGFGVPSHPVFMQIEVDPLFGLPIGAPIEKGSFVFAIVEELGIFGGVIAFGWVLMVIGKSSRQGIVPLAVCMTYFVSNFGEYTIFSPSGLGMIGLVLLGWVTLGGSSTNQGSSGKSYGEMR